MNSFPDHSVCLYSLSLVTPGSSFTIDNLCPINLLNNVDFPTFGLPTIATTGFILFPSLHLFIFILAFNNYYFVVFF